MNCIDLAIKAAKGRLTEQEIRDAFDQEAKIREDFLNSGRSDNLDERVAGKIAQEAMAKKIEQARQKRAIAQNIIVRAKLDKLMAGWQADGMSPVRSVLATAEGSQMGIKNSRDSMDANQKAYRSSYLSDMWAHIESERPHIKDLLTDKGFDNAVTAELMELREGGTPGKTGNSDAQWMAKTLGAAMDYARTDLNRKGADIGRIDGYAGPQSHDDVAMLGVTKAYWVDKIKTHFNMERSFPDENPAGIDEIIGDIYDNIITGGAWKDSGALHGQRVSPANMAKRLGRHRVLHVKDAEAAIAYRDEFGRGSTIQGIFAQLEHQAKMAGAMHTYGDNPPVMFKALVARAKQQQAEKMKGLTGKALKKAQKELKSLDIDRLNSTLEEVSLLASRPVDAGMAMIGNTIRDGQRMAKLGGATVTAVPTDTTTNALAAMFRGQGFWDGFGSFIREMSNNPQGREVSYSFAEGIDGLMGMISSAVLSDNSHGRSLLSGWTYSFFKWNGLSGWTNFARAVTVRVAAEHMGRNIGKGFDALHPRFRHVLGMNGITSEKWDAIRSVSYKEINGRIYITPDRIRTLDDAAIEKIVGPQIAEAQAQIKRNSAGEVSPSQQAKFDAKKAQIIERGRRDLEIDVRRYFADETRYGIVETDMASRRFSRWGTRPGTVPGEAIRMLMLFKGFPAAFTNRILGRAVKGGIGQTAKDRLLNNSGHIGALLAGMTVAGYASIVVKDTLRGQWPPRNPFDWRTIGAAALQGGTFGIYGDFLLGQTNRYGKTLAETAAGPVFGEFSDLWELKDQLIDGNARAGRALDFALRNTPFMGLFYVRPVMDFLWINSLRETLSPGHLARQERWSRKDRGQGYPFPRTLSEALN